MRLSLLRGTIPLTDQLKAQIRHQILAGHLGAGTRLPPVRTLAGFLRVNRNTVARAYAELEAEGVLEGTPGRGTHVVWEPRSARASRALTVQIDRLVAAAASAGMPLDGLLATVAVRAGQLGDERRGQSRPRIGFAECNPVDLAYFSRLVRDAVDVPVVPMLLEDLPLRLAEVDLLATTFFHVEEVRRRARNAGAARGDWRMDDSRAEDSRGENLRSEDSRGRDPRSIEVIGLMALPDFRTLDEVARLPSARRIALVCATREGVTSKARSLASVGLRPPRLQTATLDDPGGLAGALRQAEVVLAATRVIDRMREMIPRGVRVIPFASVLSEGAVFLLNERIAAWRAQGTSPGSRPGEEPRGKPGRESGGRPGRELGRRPHGNSIRNSGSEPGGKTRRNMEVSA